MLHVNVAGQKGLFRWDWEMRRRIKVRYLLFGRRDVRPRQQATNFESRRRRIAALTSIIIRVLGSWAGSAATDRLFLLWHTCVSLSNRSFPSTPSLTNWGPHFQSLDQMQVRVSIATFESSSSPHFGAKAQNRAVGDGGQCRGAVLASLGVSTIGCFCRSSKESNATTSLASGK